MPNILPHHHWMMKFVFVSVTFKVISEKDVSHLLPKKSYLATFPANVVQHTKLILSRTSKWRQLIIVITAIILIAIIILIITIIMNKDVKHAAQTMQLVL